MVERDPPDPGADAAHLDPFVAWRLRRLTERNASRLPVCQERLWTTPRLTRHRMVPEWIERRFVRRMFNRLFRARRPSPPGAALTHRELRQQRRRLPWIREARRRRVMLLILVWLPTLVASGFMLSVLPHRGQSWIELAIVVFFGALFGWISIGFWTAVFGFFTLIRRRRSFAITNLPELPADFVAGGRTAVCMPICEEPVDRVFAGLRAIRESLMRTGAAGQFDLFILSDSNTADTVVAEEAAWAAWCREVDGFGSIFYRRRRVRVRRKSGNVADFCRRWGAQYRYMIMLDADSIMAGSTLLRLVHLMEQRPDVGMIQTAPLAVNRRSLFARVQQFSSHVYGPMFTAGLHFWQLGDGQYWGHNTIIRIAPFMAHCALPKLPGTPPLGGEILSHDFVEAALMGRAGWTLWLAYDLGGSCEEVPSTLLEEMGRDRRWCQGNLQHLRLLFTEGLFGAHRALFVNGVLSYVSALLWFTFLVLSTVAAILEVHPRARLLPARRRASFPNGRCGDPTGRSRSCRHRRDPLPPQGAQHPAAGVPQPRIARIRRRLPLVRERPAGDHPLESAGADPDDVPQPFRRAEPARPHRRLALPGAGGRRDALERGGAPARLRHRVRQRVGLQSLLAQSRLLLVGDADHWRPHPVDSDLGAGESGLARRSQPALGPLPDPRGEPPAGRAAQRHRAARRRGPSRSGRARRWRSTASCASPPIRSSTRCTARCSARQGT